MKVAENLPELEDAIAELSHTLSEENRYIPAKFYEWLLNSETAYNMLIVFAGALYCKDIVMHIYSIFKSETL